MAFFFFSLFLWYQVGMLLCAGWLKVRCVFLTIIRFNRIMSS